MTKAKILGIQIQPELGNKEANVAKIENYIKEYGWYKPDLIIMPEVFTCGISHKFLHRYAEEIPTGYTIQLLSNLALEYKTNIIAGSIIEKDNDKYYNTSFVFNRKGNIVTKYRKIHLFDYYGSNESDYITSGNEVIIADLDIGKVGLSICYDLRFPELFRSLTKKGAEIIVCPAAWPYPRLEHWQTLIKARAIENQIYFIAVNQCEKVDIKRTNLGLSSIINPWGEIIASAGSQEGVMLAEINLQEVKKLREEFPVLKDIKTNIY